MRIRLLAILLLAVAAASACLPTLRTGSLQPTLTIEDRDGLPVAMQNGIPVPSFDWQPRERIELVGSWRVERTDLDSELTMGERDQTLADIESGGEGRQQVDHDDSAWETVDVPGAINPPPDGRQEGAWYRHRMRVPTSWSGSAVTLRFGSANYVVDVWLNGTWLGYHEGGSTPFAFDAGPALRTGAENVIAVRVHAIPLGTRVDVVPWGLVDWWDYGGLTGPVWLEASPVVHVARADVVPHLDAVEIEVLMAHASWVAGGDGATSTEGAAVAPITVSASILPATVTDANLLDPDPRSLLADGSDPIITVREETETPPSGAVRGTTLAIVFRDADLWSPARPALYVARIDVSRAEALDPREALPLDSFWVTFGIRHVTVDPTRPRVQLNGEATFFRGVGLHAEALVRRSDGTLVAGAPAHEPREILGELEDAAAVGADLVRTGHVPAHPTMLLLADRLGFAVWEEIPLYHATPVIFGGTMGRGIPQQMLREMALRDMNHPSVLFHGFANESTGVEERADALAELHEIDRAIDGTRLTGQAAYGWDPSDPTHASLDVAGFTLYNGVFYGTEPGPDTRRALREANAANPDKPIMVLEFGRWADTPADEARQRVIFEDTYRAIAQFRADRPTGFVSGATWWTLHDFATQLPGIEVEDFGLYRPDGTLRPAGEAATEAFGAPAGRGSDLDLEPEIDRARPQRTDRQGDWALAGYLAYGLGLAFTAIATAIAVLTRRGGRAVRRPR